MRNPTDRLSPLTSDKTSRTPSSAPSSITSVRKIAASVIPVRTALDPVGSITPRNVPHLQMRLFHLACVGARNPARDFDERLHVRASALARPSECNDGGV